MSFYKELQVFSEYLHSIRFLQDFITIDLKFPMNWGLPKSLTAEDKVVPFDSGDQNLKGISFVCAFEESEVTEAISKINKVIKLNKDREIKERLFKETIETLKKTFETTDLDTLKSLYFDFEKKENTLDNGSTGGASLELVEERTTQRPKRTRIRKEETDSADQEA